MPLKAGYESCGDGNSIQIELQLQLAGPLFDQMRWAKNRETIRLASIDQLAQDETTFDGFADPDIVRDEQSADGKPQRHQQRNELISARLKAQARGGPKRPCAAPERQPQCIRQKTCPRLRCDL